MGLDRFRFGRGDFSKPHAGPTGDDGCTGVAEEGNACTPPRSARPSLGLPAHEIRAIGSRRRKAPARWMPGHYRSRQAFTGESGSGDVSAAFVARGTSASSLARGESPRNTELEGDCGLRRDARVEARELCSYVVFENRLQKSTGDHCWPHRSSFTGPMAGPIARSAGSERGPSPTRRTLLTLEKSRTEAEPRAKQASRGSGRTWQLPRRLRLQARRGVTSAHEGKALALFAARWALLPRRSASLAHAKWPLSIEGVPRIVSFRPSVT